MGLLSVNSILVAGRLGAAQEPQLRQALHVYRSEQLRRLTPSGVICIAHGDIALLTECDARGSPGYKHRTPAECSPSRCSLSLQNRDLEYASRSPTFNYTRSREP
jgi:hypothetical protein